MKYVLAVDGGNSKTLAAVADETGKIVSLARRGGSNYQGIGRESAQKAIWEAVSAAMDGAGISEVEASCYGIAGADRDKDFKVIRRLIAPFDPGKKSALVNDTLLALRAATSDGVGVALIGGAGSNCIGMDKNGIIKKAWGLGPMTGDRANGGALVLDAVVAAMKGFDGRGPKTALEEKFKTALKLEALEDIIEIEFFDSRQDLDLRTLAPLVFEAANEGDQAALSILRDHGRAAGEAALAVMRGLFTKDHEVTLALGGSVLQKGDHSALNDEIRKMAQAEFPRVRFIVLDEHPLLGGILRAMDEAGMESGGAVLSALREDLGRRLAAARENGS